MTRVLEPFDINELETEHKLIIDALRDSKSCIGMTSETCNSEIEPTIRKVKTKLTSNGVSSYPQEASIEIKVLKVVGITISV